MRGRLGQFRIQAAGSPGRQVRGLFVAAGAGLCDPVNIGWIRRGWGMPSGARTGSRVLKPRGRGLCRAGEVWPAGGCYSPGQTKSLEAARGRFPPWPGDTASVFNQEEGSHADVEF